MEVQELVEPSTPAISNKNSSLWTEDSGYHTSFTPGSIEVSNENLEPSHGKIRISGQIQVSLTPETISRTSWRLGSVQTSARSECFSESPVPRRGLKRPIKQGTDEGCHSFSSTPTSKIAGGIQKLRVNDSSNTSQSSVSFLLHDSGQSNLVNNDLSHINNHGSALSYPSTPVKKICRTSCKLSPMRRSSKKPSFAMHSLSCEAHGVIKNSRKHSKVVRTIQFRPEQKIDIIKMLYQDARAYPPLIKILGYLSNEDICTFRQTNPLWSHVWDDLGKSKKDEYKNFLRNIKENQENRDKSQTAESSDGSQIRSLKEVHNMLNSAGMTKNIPRSPPGTPRTNKFRKFTKSASLDSRLQLSCIRCSQPSKVTVETSGEEWAECTSTSCSYQFCRFCCCNRHPGKICLTYDLGRPSPSKRKNIVAVATRKSKGNLRRLLL